MYFNKYPYISNFDFLKSNELKAEGSQATWSAPTFDAVQGAGVTEIVLGVDQLEHDTYLVTAKGQDWQENHSQSELQLPSTAVEPGLSEISIGDNFELLIKDKNGTTILSSVQGQSFGKAGGAHMFQFHKPTDTRCYGMGEKMLGMELSNVKTKFWNTDVWADFDPGVYLEGRPDPMYVSVPYLIVKSGEYWVGLLLDNPHATFIRTNNNISIAGQMDAKEQSEFESITLGSEQGQPRLIITVAKSLAELTRQHQNMVGKTPLPPAWSLGYHQCRWGYESMHDLNYLDAGLKRNDIPCDGLWLDIEYMDGYRVFTFDDKHFPQPEQNLTDIQSRGRKVVPIIDPGVKAEPGYSVYESGRQGSHYCKNPQGKDFVGLVWPGETVFPDYSREDSREWWAEQVKSFAQLGFKGAWLDMNDPATGDSLNDLMLFDRGTKNHSSFHNQYGMGMARASRDGFLKANPEERPFLLSRSGFTGTSKYAAIWTGDNVSNYHYLKGSIATTLNLALSGIPFNGPDVAGFGKDTNPQLMIDWIKAGFLFPILRNHSCKGTADQEPWAFDHKTTDIYRHYVQMRYKLRPYLYNLFAEQELCGEAILRPMFYDFENETANDLSRIDDQFMVGSAILQAPFVEEGQQHRSLILPSARWYDTQNGIWIEGGRSIEVEKEELKTPLYLRDGSLLPMSRNTGDDNTFSSRQIDLHLVISNTDGNCAQYQYHFDDGNSFQYQKGERSTMAFTAEVRGGCLYIETELKENGYGDLDFSLVCYDHFDKVMLNGVQRECSNSDFQWVTGQKTLLAC